MNEWNEHEGNREEWHEEPVGRHEDSVPNDDLNEGPSEGESPMEERVSAAFFHEVMRDLSDTNFARGWGDPTMYRDFLSWCELSEDADRIIAEFSPQIPCLLVDEVENVRLVSMQARVASVLMRALLDAYEQKRIEEFLSR